MGRGGGGREREGRGRGEGREKRERERVRGGRHSYVINLEKGEIRNVSVVQSVCVRRYALSFQGFSVVVFYCFFVFLNRL